MQEYQQRVQNERLELVAKLTALQNFLESDKFDVIDPEQQHLLVQQHFVMNLYDDILCKRLAQFNAQ